MCSYFVQFTVQKHIKMKFFLLVLFSLCSYSLFSQQDSLKKFSNDELFSKAQKQNKIIYLEELGTRNLTTHELLNYYEVYKRLSYQIGDYQKVKQQSLELLKLSKRENDSHYEFVAALGLLEVEFALQDYKNCLKYYRLSKSIIKSLPDSPDKAVASIDADFFYYLSGDFEQYIKLTGNSINDLKKYESASQKPEDIQYVKILNAGALLYVANAYMMMQDFENAEIKLSEGEKILKENFPDEGLTFNILAKIIKGKLLLFQKKFTESIPVFEQCLKLADDYHFDDFKYQSHIFLGMNYFNTKDYQKSLYHSESAIRNPQKVADFIDFDLEAKRYAFFASKSMDLKEKSIRYADLFMSKNSELVNQKRNNFVNQIIQNTYVEDFQNRNETLKYYLLLIALVSSAAVVSVYYFQRKKTKRQFEKFQKVISELNDPGKNDEEIKVTFKTGKSKELSDEKSMEILQKLQKFEKGKLFLKPEMSLAFLAGHLQTNVNTLSATINQYKKQNFNDYINGLRIDYIVKKLQSDNQYKKFKISSLAQECGFSSHSIFTIAFKKRTEVSPSQFISFLDCQ